MARRHTERHRTDRIGWLRAAVLGANDGIVSTASLLVGVAAASASHDNILVTGVAGLVAGAMSMAAGEYVSVHSQADTEAADLARESAELKADPAAEMRELTAIYVSRGLDATLAGQVAAQLMAHDPQCSGSPAAASQPTVGLSLQWSQPGSHAPATTQRPATQLTPSAATCGSPVQSVSHPPQWRGSRWRSTHAPPHTLPPSQLAGAPRSAPGTSKPKVATGGRPVSPPHDAAMHASTTPAAPFRHADVMGRIVRQAHRAPQ